MPRQVVRARRHSVAFHVAVSVALTTSVYGVDVSDSGTPGSTPGGAGGSALANASSADPSNNAIATGGGGGQGAAGADNTADFGTGGPGGAAGHGGNATATVSNPSHPGSVNNNATASGGAGGSGGSGGGGGNQDHPGTPGAGGPGSFGGDATANATGQNNSDDAVSVTASASGGGGGSGGSGHDGSSAPGGNGGNASASAFGSSTGGGNVSVFAYINGTIGAAAGGTSQSKGSAGGNGHNATLTNGVDGFTIGNLFLTQSVAGGNSGGADSASPGLCGNAVSSLILTRNGMSYFQVGVDARGGSGGNCSNVTGSMSGAANATADITSDSPMLINVTADPSTGSSVVNGTGGAGADTFATGKANNTSTVAERGTTTVNSTAYGCTGGNAFNGAGGAGGGGNATATGFNNTSDPLTVQAIAFGGYGGTGNGFNGGNGGFGFLGSGGAGGGPNNAANAVIARSTGSGSVTADGRAVGGNGGDAFNANGGNGASEFVNDLFADPTTASVGNAGALKIIQAAQGGTGGSAFNDGAGGAAGDAKSTLTLTRNNVAEVQAIVDGFAGSGGSSTNHNGAPSGFGASTLTLISNSPLIAVAKANLPVESVSFNPPQGGSSDTGTGGAGGIGSATAAGTGTGTAVGHSSVTVTAYANGCNGGLGNHGGAGGNADATAVGIGAGPDFVNVAATANGGPGGNGIAQGGGIGGNATALASGSNTFGANVQVSANATGGSGGTFNSGMGAAATTGQAFSIANAAASSSGQAFATASSIGSTGAAKSDSQALSNTPVYFARGISQSFLDSSGSAVSVSQIGGGYSPSFVSMSANANSLIAGMPDSTTVIGAWQSAPHVQFAFNNDPSVAKGYGAVGMIHPSQTSGFRTHYVTTGDFAFDVSKLGPNDRLVAGLLSAPIVGAGLGAGDSLVFKLLRDDRVVSAATFTSNAQIATYFQDGVPFYMGLAKGSSLSVTFLFDLFSGTANNGVEADFVVGTTPTALGGEWNSTQSGRWHFAPNWQNYFIPSGAGAFVKFGSVNFGATSVELDSDTTAGSIVFDSNNSYAITPSATPTTLTLDNIGSNSLINVVHGGHSIDVPVSLVGDASITTAAGSGLNISGTISGTGALQLSGTGTIALGGAFNSYVGNTVVNSGAQLIVGNGTASGSVSPFGQLIVNGTTTFSGNTGFGIAERDTGSIALASTGKIIMNPGASPARSVLAAPDITFAGTTDAWGGLLDLNNNDAVLYNGNLANVANQIRQGYNHGSWNGTAGIRSSSAAASSSAHRTALGYALAGELSISSFDNLILTASDLLIKYTFPGDANLDGMVNTADFNRLAVHFNSVAGFWSDGDFNYDGIVNGLDFNAISTNFGQALPAGAAPASLVPEPAACLLIASPLLLRRRRNRHPHGR